MNGVSKIMKAFLEPEEVKSLESSATCLRDRLLIRILFHLGCRISEALGLEVKDIDFKRGIVTIQHLKTRINLACPDCGTRLAKNHSFCPKCGLKVKEAVAKEQEHRKMRALPLDSDSMEMLQNYIKRGGPVEDGNKRMLFGISRHRGWQVVKECAEKARLPKLVNPETGKVHNVSPHKLRDAFAVNAIKRNDSGDGLRLLQEHLGHSNFNTTAKYRKVSGEELNDWYQKLWEEPDMKNDKRKVD